MKLSRADWPQYKRETLLALAVLTAGLVLVGGSHYLYQTAEQSFQQAAADLQSAQATLANVENERAELEASLPLYRNLTDRSIIGGEQRLNWHETLQAERERQALGKVAFSLASRRPIQTDQEGGAVADGLFRRYRSTMKLSAEFLHETAFVDFLERIADQAHALTILRACQMNRMADPGQSATWSLAAECTIDWATLERAAPASEANPS